MSSAWLGEKRRITVKRSRCRPRTAGCRRGATGRGQPSASHGSLLWALPTVLDTAWGELAQLTPLSGMATNVSD